MKISLGVSLLQSLLTLCKCTGSLQVIVFSNNGLIYEKSLAATRGQNKFSVLFYLQF